jgi:hypothetical protein
MFGGWHSRNEVQIAARAVEKRFLQQRSRNSKLGRCPQRGKIRQPSVAFGSNMDMAIMQEQNTEKGPMINKFFLLNCMPENINDSK